MPPIDAAGPARTPEPVDPPAIRESGPRRHGSGLSARRAYEIFSDLMSEAGGSGTGFYQLRLNDGRPRSEAHRAACLAYLDGVVLPHLEARGPCAAYPENDARRTQRSERLNDLLALREFIARD